MYRLVLLLLPLILACQNQVQNPETWTVQELHIEVGLVGGHELACADCHLEASFKSIPSNCESCHRALFDKTTNPDHHAAGYPIRCKECHESIAWQPASVAHDTLDFALEGAHGRILCIDCHLDNDFSSLAADCIDCHDDDFNAAVDPNHIEQLFSQDCTECHSIDAWEPATFDHDLTEFPLTGAHKEIEADCTSCHTGGIFAELASDCIDCHEDDFKDVEDPNHVEQLFSQDCTECHSLDAWEPATFDHDLTEFPLTGAHKEIEADCVSCHIAGVFAELPSDCIDCHQKDEPVDHFSPECVECHTTTAWEPSTFDHEPLFPLIRGNHKEYRDSCTSCHLDPAAYEIFTCTDCHDGEHDRPDMDDEHDDVRDYTYETLACFECHPRGNEDDAEGDDD
ncbi:MAG: nitrate/TMAO reductase-like tetraheme cytochrome c subunit [Candidatus Latescibacterota bacterium]|jgi:nitrate/TMAO reductase-like tetraheme cytochrome c subunit